MPVDVPLYSEIDYGNMQPLSLKDWTPSVWDSMRFSFREAWNTNPTPSMQRWADTSPDQAQGTVFSGMDDFAAAGIAGAVRDLDGQPASANEADERRALYEDAARRASERGYARKEIRRASLDRQRELIEEAGLTGAIQPHENYTEDALKVILDGKKQQRAAQFVAEKSPGWHLPFSLAAGLAASVLDPANIVAGLVPTIGEQRMASLLAANAKSAWGRAGARAMQGAASGALGAALVEPVVYAGQQSMQADYDMYMSLMNIGMGAAMGAAITPAAGAVREFLNVRRGIAMPWQIEQATPQSEALRNGAVEMLERARLAARPDQDAASVHAQAVDDIFLLDDHLRRRALAENITAEEAWQRYAPDFKSGERFRLRAERLEAQAKSLAEEMEALQSRRAMLEQFPEMRQTADDLDVLPQRLEMTRAQAQQARLEHAAFMEELAGGDTYYMAREPADWSKVARGENPQLIQKVQELKPLLINTADAQGMLLPVPARKEMKARIQAANQEDLLLNVDGFKKPMLLSKRGMIETISHGYNDDLAMTMPHLREIIEGAVYAGEGKRHGDVKTHLFVNRVQINGKESMIAIVAREDCNGLRFYDHDLRELKDRGTRLGGRHLPLEDEDTSIRKSPDRLQSILREWLGVKNEYLTGAEIPPDKRILFQRNSANEIMGAITFRKERRAEINIFRAHDHSTAVHEIGHAVLHDLEEMAALPGMAPRVQKQVQALRRKYNVPEGEAWSREAQEAFAEDFARFAKGEDPAEQAVAQAFVMLRERALDRYGEADAAGVQISQPARDVFNAMLSLPVERGQREFNNAIADVLTRRWEQEFLPADPHRKPGDAAGLAGDPSVAARELEGARAGQSHFDPGDLAEADPRNAQMLSRIADSEGQALDMELARDGVVPPEIREGIRAERDAELAGIRRELEDIPNQENDMAEYLSCILAGG